MCRKSLFFGGKFEFDNFEFFILIPFLAWKFKIENSMKVQQINFGAKIQEWKQLRKSIKLILARKFKILKTKTFFQFIPWKFNILTIILTQFWRKNSNMVSTCIELQSAGFDSGGDLGLRQAGSIIGGLFGLFNNRQ